MAIPKKSESKTASMTTKPAANANSGSKKDQQICIGKIVGVKGIEGAVKIYSYTEDPRHIGRYGALHSNDGSRQFNIKTREFKGNVIVSKIEGVETRNAAEALVGTELFVWRSTLPELESRKFYYADLLGLGVVDEAGKSLGRVVSVYNYGGGDVIEIAKPRQFEPICVLFNEENFPKVDVGAGILTARLPVESNDDAPMMAHKAARRK